MQNQDTLQSDLIGHTDSACVIHDHEGNYLLRIIGWIAHKTCSIDQFTFSFKGGPVIKCQAIKRDDVSKKLPLLAHNIHVGYSVDIPLREYHFENKFSLIVTVLLSNGGRFFSPLEINLNQGSPVPQRTLGTSNIYGSEESIATFRRMCDIQFQYFLNNRERFIFDAYDVPTISVVLVAHNQASLTYACLKSLLEQQNIGIEVTIIDNASTDETAKLLAKVYGARILTNETNLHYLEAANQGAIASRGDYLLFLNNDLVLLPGSLQSALNVFRKESRVGAVGAKLIRPDGRLQEAGSQILNDGSTRGIGIGQDPFDEKFLGRVDVDYCSGAFLLTPRALFLDMKMFDPSYAPAYYEDVDYCVRLKEYGYRVLYDPGAGAIHVHHASAESNVAAYEHMNKNRPLFAKRHATYLRKLESPGRKPSESFETNVLFIDDFIPNPYLGQGQPRSLRILQSLDRKNIPVSVIGLNSNFETESNAEVNLPSSVTTTLHIDKNQLEHFLLIHRANFSHIFVSRPTNMETISLIMKKHPDLFSTTKIIYDAEAVFAIRDLGKKALLENIQFTDQDIKEVTRIETAISSWADLIVTVSDGEFLRFVESGFSRIEKLSHVVYPRFHTPTFEERRGIMSLGPLLSSDSPNTDAARWFIKQVVPLLPYSSKLGGVHFAGAISKDILSELLTPDVVFTGPVLDPMPLYDRSKIFFSSIRYGAGIPLKVIEAAAAGIPTVISKIAALQLGWESGYECLVAQTPEEFVEAINALDQDAILWRTIQGNALKKVSEEFNQETFDTSLQTIITNA